MKKLFLFMCICCFSLKNSAQQFSGLAAGEFIKGAKSVTYNPIRKSVDFAVFQQPFSIPLAELKDWLKKDVLKVSANEELVLYKTETDMYGFTHFRYKQQYKGLPVEDGVYYVHTKNGATESVNGEYYGGINISTTATISGFQAFQSALNIAHAQQYRWEIDKMHTMQSVIDSIKLVVVKVEEKYELAYKVDVYSTIPHKRQLFYIDANKGTLLSSRDLICTIDSKGQALTAYSGLQTITTDSVSSTSFFLTESGRGGGIETIIGNHTVPFSNSTNYWKDTTNLVNYATDVHFGVERSFDFFKTRFGRNSFDNANGKIRSAVYVGDTSLLTWKYGWNNAEWDYDMLIFGTGDHVNYFPMTSLEIVGHEFTHGVTEFSAALVYSWESGSLNESFSDIFGASIRFIDTPLNGSWLIGNQLVKGGYGQPFRSMSDPKKYLSPDTYKGLYYNTGDIVHYNSGIQNHWYYLLTAGGAGVNDNNNAYSVNGIGLDDALSIAYRNLTVYLTPNATFSDARIYSDQAAIDLFGICSNQRAQNLNAWYAVGVGGDPRIIAADFSSTTNFSCTAPATVTFNNQTVDLTGTVTYEWSFGDGITSTVASPSHLYATPGNYDVKLVASGMGACSFFKDSLIKTSFVKIAAIKPVAGFSFPSTNIPIMTPVAFVDQSLNGVGSWKWDFGDGGSAASQNPTHTFNSPGIYSVKLIVSNCYSTDTIIKNITITTDYLLCKDSVSYSSTGTLYDSGGPDGNYSILENCSFLIAPPCAGSIALTFEQFRTSTVFATVYVYDGSSAKAPLLSYTGWGKTAIDGFTGSGIAPVTLNSSTGKLFVTISVPYTVATDSGFKATWTSIPSTKKPLAAFLVDNIRSSQTPMNFTDQSTNGATFWKWDFGDGGVSGEENPVHTFASAGTYNVILIVSNCNGSDTIMKQVTIDAYVSMCVDSASTKKTGTLYDSGGPTGNYSKNENCLFTIEPPCAYEIDFTFSDVHLARGDSIYYNNALPVRNPFFAFEWNGYSGTRWQFKSGKMYILLVSDTGSTSSGFQLSWTSKNDTITPKAGSILAPATAKVNELVSICDSVHFIHSWDLGDGTKTPFQWMDSNITCCPNGASENCMVHSYKLPGVYTIKLLVRNCLGVDSVTQQIIIEDPTGIQGHELSGIHIFPNPANKKINIQFDQTDNKIVTVELLNAIGERVLFKEINKINSGSNSTAIDVSMLASGSYYVIAKAGDALLREKLFIIR